MLAGHEQKSETKSEATRNRILDVAARMFREHGYAATTLNEVAKAAALKKGSLYYHFDSKEQLIEEVLSIGIARVSEAVRAALVALPGTAASESKLYAAVEAHLRSLLDLGDYTSAAFRQFGQLPAEVRSRHTLHRQRYAEQWRELLSELQAAGDIDSNLDLSRARMFLFGGMNWSMEWFDADKSPVEEYAAEVCRMFLHGVRPLDS